MALIIQERGVVIQHVWLHVVFRCQCGDVLIDSDDLSSILRRIALGLIGVDQRFLTGDIFQDRIFFDFNDFLRLADLLFPRLIFQQSSGSLVVAHVDHLQGVPLAPVQGLAQLAFFRGLTEQLQDIHFQRVELLCNFVPLLTVCQQALHGISRWVLCILQCQFAHLVFQLGLLCQKLLDRLIFTVKRDVCHGEHLVAVQGCHAVLDLHCAAYGLIAGQFQQHIQFERVHIAEGGIIMPDLLIQTVHEITDVLAGRFPLWQLPEVGVNLRSTGFSELIQCRIKFLDRVDGIVCPVRASAEEDVEILCFPDGLVVLRLLPVLCHRIGKVLADGELKIDAAWDVNIVQRADEIAQACPLLREFDDGRRDKQLDVLHLSSSCIPCNAPAEPPARSCP